MQSSISFKAFKALVEDHIGKMFKVLKCCNVGEYSSKNFDACRETRIKNLLIVPYNPQQNGVVERKNQCIIETTKALTHDWISPRVLGYRCAI